jgi:hypothetical protein
VRREKSLYSCPPPGSCSIYIKQPNALADNVL